MEAALQAYGLGFGCNCFGCFVWEVAMVDCCCCSKLIKTMTEFWRGCARSPLVLILRVYAITRAQRVVRRVFWKFWAKSPFSFFFSRESFVLENWRSSSRKGRQASNFFLYLYLMRFLHSYKPLASSMLFYMRNSCKKNYPASCICLPHSSILNDLSVRYLTTTLTDDVLTCWLIYLSSQTSKLDPVILSNDFFFITIQKKSLEKCSSLLFLN